MISRSLARFLDDYSGKSGVWISVASGRLDRPDQLPREVQDVVKSVANTTGSVVKAVKSDRDDILTVLHYLVNAAGLSIDKDTLVSDADKFTIKFDEYAEGPSFRLVKITSMEGNRPAEASAAPGAPARPVTALAADQVAFKLNGPADAGVKKMSAIQQAALTKTLVEFCKVFGLSKVNVLSSGGGASASRGSRPSQIALEVYPFRDIGNTRNANMVALASGFVDVDSGTQATIVRAELKDCGIKFGEQQKHFFADSYYVPNFLRTNGQSTLFPTKDVNYDAETILTPDGIPIGMYSAVNKEGRAWTSYFMLYNDVLGGIQNEDDGWAAIKEYLYATIYLTRAIRGKAIADQLVTNLRTEMAQVESDGLKAMVEWLDTYTPKVEYPVARVAKEAVEIMMGNINDQVKDIQKQIDTKVAEVTRLYQQIQQKYNEIDGLKARQLQLELSKRNKESQYDQVTGAVSAVCNNKYIRSVHIYGGNMLVYTNNIEVVLGNRDLVFDIGRLVITVPLKNGSPELIRFLNLDRKPNGRTIPHAHGGADVCWGNKGEQVGTALRQGDLVTLINLVTFFATSTNIKDPYGTHIVDFPVSKDGRIKKLGSEMKTKILSQRFETENVIKAIEKDIEEDDDE